MEKKNTFFKAGAVLALSGIMIKALSAVYRIPLTRMLGADTMGRYSAMLNLFMPFFSFSTAGITTAVANCTAVHSGETRTDLYTIRRKAVELYTVSAVIVAIIFAISGRIYAYIQKDMLYFYGAFILAPAIVLTAAENVFKGITQGQMNMLPTAQAGLIESFFKTATGLAGVWLAMHFMPADKKETALMASLAAITLSGLICTIFLWFKSRTEKTVVPTEKTVNSRDMLKISVPVGVSALTVSLTSFFDTAFCLPRISGLPYTSIVKSFSGASFMGAGDITMYLFGVWQGMVLTVFNLVPSIVSSAGTAALPLISRSWQRKNKKLVNSSTEKLFKATSALCVPAFAFIFCFGADIIRFLFGTTTQQTVVAEQLLRILCTTGVFCCFGNAFNTVLYAADKADRVFAVLLSACVVKSAVGYILCGVATINIKAFAVSGGCFYTIIFVRSIAELKKLGINFDFIQIFAIPVLTSAVSVLVVKWIADTQFYSLPLFFKLFFSGTVFVCIYILAIICTGFIVDK